MPKYAQRVITPKLIFKELKMISEKNCSFFTVKISLYNYRCPSLLYADTKVLEKKQNFVSDILTFIFDMERVLLQPANSLLQPAKKVRI